MPRPPGLVVWKASKIRSALIGSKPIPESRTTTWISPAVLNRVHRFDSVQGEINHCCFADTTSGTCVTDGRLKVPARIGVFKFAELERGCADPKVLSLR